jgi:type IV secretory pathway VirB10-like protein
MSDSESPTGPRHQDAHTRADPKAVSGLRPALPLAQRLNRNALVVAACILGMAALVAVVFLAPAKSSTASAGDGTGQRSTLPPPQPPSFMDRLGPPSVAQFGDGHGATGDTARAVIPPLIATDSGRRGLDRYATANDADATIYRSSPATEPVRLHADSDDDYQRALVSPLVFAAASSGDRGMSGEPTSGTDVEGIPAGAGAVPRLATPLGPSVENGRSSTRLAMSPRDVAVSTTTVRVHSASAGYLLAAGSVVSAVLLTALNSDLPGEVGAQVVRDVYDSPTQTVVLIPKGAKLVGRCVSAVIHGQKRVALTWVRVNLPNGATIDLPSEPATDERGAAGVPADVDNHVFRTFSAAGIAAAIGAGVELSQPQNGSSVLTTPTVGQVLAGSLGQELGTVGLEIVRRELDVPPTLTIPPGALFNLLLTTDLSFVRPYAAPAP